MVTPTTLWRSWCVSSAWGPSVCVWPTFEIRYVAKGVTICSPLHDAVCSRPVALPLHGLSQSRLVAALVDSRKSGCPTVAGLGEHGRASCPTLDPTAWTKPWRVAGKSRLAMNPDERPCPAVVVENVVRCIPMPESMLSLLSLRKESRHRARRPWRG